MAERIPKLLIWGSSGHALVVADIIRLAGQFEIAGFIDDRPEHRGKTVCGAMVLGDRSELDKQFDRGARHIFLALGDGPARLRLAELARSKGFGFATAIHPRSTVAADAFIGDGTLIVAGSVINPGAKIGAHVIVNTAASVDHECVIEDGAHVGPGARLGGRAHVGRGAWIGIGAVVSDRVQIGAESVVGAGAVVVRDIPAGVVAYGVPARVMGSVKQKADD